MGRLVKDRQEEIDTVIWTASNKVKEIRRNFDSSKKNIIFDFDAMGNQIAKHVYNNQTLMLEKSTYYILDAQGNQLSIYEHSVDSATNTAYYYLTDRNIYGSSRLGVTKDTINMFNPYTLQSYGVVGNRNYELTDHRGNVQTVINDIKYPLSSDNTTVDSYEVGVSSVYDYSPFGVQLDGRTIDNVFYHPESTVDTVSVTAYALEETFDIASNWQEITTETQITYPSGKMRVRNPMSNRKKIGVKNEFITGEGLHSLSFEITYLPYTLCPIIVFPGEPIFPSQTNDSILDSEEFHIQSVKNSYLVFEIFDENSISILIDSTRSVGTYSYNFTALEGENYSVLFYINSLCNTRYFEIDNVFITYEEEAIVENTNAFIATNYRYSVQNQEHHDEIRGKGNYINYKYRGHDPRVGRLDWMIDPLAKDYPFYSPYAFSGNRVLDAVELEGLEPASVHLILVNDAGEVEYDNILEASGTGHLGSYHLENLLPNLGLKSKDFALNSHVTIKFNVDAQKIEGLAESASVYVFGERKTANRELSNWDKYGPVSIFGETFANKVIEIERNLYGIKGARNFAEGITYLGSALSMLGIPGGAAIEGFGLGYSSYLDFESGDEKAREKLGIRIATFGTGIGIGKSIDKTGIDQGMKQLQKAGVGVATGEIREEAIEFIEKE